MKNISTLVTLIFVSTISLADSIKISDLGELELEFATATQTNEVRGSQVIARTTEQFGQGFVLNAPTNIQQISYILNNGDSVKKGQSFAILRGPEVHHFITQFKVYQKLLTLTEQRMKNNRSLFEKNLIGEEKWLIINNNYFDAMLEFEHMRHFHDLIVSIDETDDSITIKAPIEGVFTRPTNRRYFPKGESIARFVPQKAIRLQLQIATEQANTIKYVEYDSCKLNITNKSSIASGAFVEVWTESLPSQCDLFLGQQVMVYPFFQQQAFQIPKSAVFSLNGENSVLVKSANQLRIVNVSLITSVDGNYLLTSSFDLTNSQVLTSSVSAVQGLLIGLGGE